MMKKMILITLEAAQTWNK